MSNFRNHNGSDDGFRIIRPTDRNADRRTGGFARWRSGQVLRLGRETFQKVQSVFSASPTGAAAIKTDREIVVRIFGDQPGRSKSIGGHSRREAESSGPTAR